MKQSTGIGDRIVDKSSQPNERTIRDWMGPEACEHWVELRSWIEASYPGVFAPDWLWWQETRLVTALQEDQGFVHAAAGIQAAVGSGGLGAS